MSKRTCMMGEAAAKRGDTKAAFSEYSKAVELQPSDPDALVELGKILMTMNQNDKAQQVFERR